jgi:hypothetical protein
VWQNLSATPYNENFLARPRQIGPARDRADINPTAIASGDSGRSQAAAQAQVTRSTVLSERNIRRGVAMLASRPPSLMSDARAGFCNARSKSLRRRRRSDAHNPPAQMPRSARASKLERRGPLVNITQPANMRLTVARLAFWSFTMHTWKRNRLKCIRPASSTHRPDSCQGFRAMRTRFHAPFPG